MVLSVARDNHDLSGQSIEPNFYGIVFAIVMLYFAYGSNMSTSRLVGRVPSAEVVAVARLHNHRLKFHKRSRKDGSGKCDAEHTNDQSDIVYGVVFQILSSEKPKLDELEGLGHGYEEKRVSVYTRDDEQLDAITYYATNIDPTLRPYEWYKEHVIRGAREHGLPTEYTNTIAIVAAVSDPDQMRHERELSIYS